MLALTRKKGDSIVIGDNIEITIISIQGEQVKIGINAPKEISVHRKEIYEQIVLANKEAISSSDISKIKDIFNF